MNRYNVGVFGATGMVGKTLLQVIEERNFPVENLYAYASQRSQDRLISFDGKDIRVEIIDEADFSELDFAFFATDSAVSKVYVPRAAQAGAVAIDNSSAFRQAEGVHIIVPEVNGHLLSQSQKIIANPNCSTAQLVVALYPLHKAFGLKRVVVSTYQAVSGSGVPGVEQLEAELRGTKPENPCYPHPIFNNCLPHIGSFDKSGYCEEESKMVSETRKIMGLPNLIVVPTTVRVPVSNCHSESVLAEFENPLGFNDAREVLEKAENVVLLDAPQENLYPLATIANNRDEVFVGRLREIPGWPNALQLWIVSDNLRKGAATNVLQIAERLISLK